MIRVPALLMGVVTVGAVIVGLVVFQGQNVEKAYGANVGTAKSEPAANHVAVRASIPKGRPAKLEFRLDFDDASGSTDLLDDDLAGPLGGPKRKRFADAGTWSDDRALMIRGKRAATFPPTGKAGGAAKISKHLLPTDQRETRVRTGNLEQTDVALRFR